MLFFLFENLREINPRKGHGREVIHFVVIKQIMGVIDKKYIYDYHLIIKYRVT